MTEQAKLLLDTHVVLWWLADDATLAEDLKVMIDEEVYVYVSVVTVWEVAIKQRMGKISAPADLPEQIRDSELQQLLVTFDDAIAAGRLPSIHRDPFDRMLIAQAQSHGLTLVTRDQQIIKYDDVTCLKA